ncbi:amidase [Rhodococcus aerolatus]
MLERASWTNAVVATRYAAARAEADAADARVAAAAPDEVLPPLLGVPATVKELIAVEGMPNTGGFGFRKDYRPRADAPVVARLRQAGAIVVGTGNAAGPLYWAETLSFVHGRTNNVYDPTRTAGGSSGGDGAAVGSGGSVLALGSDLAGSLRIPAALNGVFAHLPSPGLVPTTGHFPMPSGRIRRAIALGPITRRAADLEPVLRAIAGPDPGDPAVVPTAIGDPATVDLDGMTVLLSTDHTLVPVREELLTARRHAAEALEARGARVGEYPLTQLRWTVGHMLALVLADLDAGESLRDILTPTFLPRGRRGAWYVEAPLGALGLLERSPVRALRSAAAGRALDAVRRTADDLTEALDGGVLLHPPFPRAAPHHGRTVAQPWVFGNTLAFNLLALPTTQVPLGLDRQGLPLGVQVAAADGDDHVTIAVAQELERAMGGWVPPPLR